MIWLTHFAQAGPPAGMAGMPGWMFGAAAMLLTIVLGVGLWLFLRLNRGPGGGDPACGSCGYLVRGLSTFICPECGADLRDVGIVKSGRSTGGIAAGPPTAWVLICWVVGVAYLLVLNRKGAPNGNIEQWLAITLVLTCGAAAAGVWLIARRMRSPDKRAGAAVPLAGAAEPSVASTQPGTTVSRTLSIMFIDVEDFTGLAAASSREGLIGVIRRARELVTPRLAQRHGRLIKTMGDGFLITFESPTDAVLCGRDVQVEAAARALTEGEQSLRFRIGVTTGEVALEDNDVFGDPVNLASRIQQIAPPGEVYFSEATYHAMTKSEVPHEAVGEFVIKGVAEKVKLFKVAG